MTKSINIKDSLKLIITEIPNNNDAVILKLDGLIDTYNSSLLQKDFLLSVSVSQISLIPQINSYAPPCFRFPLIR